MFANAQLARMAAEKELEEAQGRTTAQHALANARAQAAQRALVVAKEKASNEAKSEFMSLMCHEVRRRLLSHSCKCPQDWLVCLLLQGPVYGGAANEPCESWRAQMSGWLAGAVAVSLRQSARAWLLGCAARRQCSRAGCFLCRSARR